MATFACRFPARALCLALALTLLVGCEIDSWGDPSQVGRWERTPVVLPILEQLEFIDEPPSQAEGTTAVQPEDLIPEISEYVIGSGDFLSFNIFELINPGQAHVETRVVDELGKVRLPIIDEVHCAGETPSSLEAKISDILQARGILKDPMVSVIVQQGRQNTYSITGEPNTSSTRFGTYQISRPEFRLLEAMAQAGGVDGRTKTLFVIRKVRLPSPHVRDGAGPVDGDGDGALVDPIDPDELIDRMLEGEAEDLPAMEDGQPPAELDAALDQPVVNEPVGEKWEQVDGEWVRVVQGVEGKPTRLPELPFQGEQGDEGTTVVQRIIRVPYARLLEGDLRQNIVVRPGDIIRVPPPVIGNIYIMGQISRPGTFGLPGDKDLTLKQLIAAAGNLAPTAAPNRVDLIRRVGDDREAMVRINLKAIFEGTQPDFYLKPNDLINVGTSALGVPLAVVRNGFRMSYGFGFLLDRNFDDQVFGSQLGTGN